MAQTVDFITEDFILTMDAKVFFAQSFILLRKTPQVKQAPFAKGGKKSEPQKEYKEGKAQPEARFVLRGHGWR